MALHKVSQLLLGKKPPRRGIPQLLELLQNHLWGEGMAALTQKGGQGARPHQLRSAERACPSLPGAQTCRHQESGPVGPTLQRCKACCMTPSSLTECACLALSLGTRPPARARSFPQPRASQAVGLLNSTQAGRPARPSGGAEATCGSPSLPSYSPGSCCSGMSTKCLSSLKSLASWTCLRSSPVQ